MFLLVPAHPGFPGQISQSRKTVVCVCVCFHALLHVYYVVYKQEFNANPGRRWLDSLLQSHDDEDEEKAPSSGSPQFVDVFRWLHPTMLEAYTNWCTLTGARATNFGCRLDYIIADVGLVPCLVSCDIMNEVEGSDHCPVRAEFNVHVTAARKCPPLCTKYLPQFAGRQQTLATFFGKKNVKPDEPMQQHSGWQGSQLSGSEHGSQCSGSEQSSQGPLASDISPSPSDTVEPCEDGPQSVKRGGETGDSSSAVLTKQHKLSDNKQSSLLSFFGKHSLTNGASKKPRAPSSQSVVSNADSANLLVVHEQRQSDSVPEANVKLHNGETASKWKTLLKGPPRPPLCKGHKEPCVLRTVKKDGPNKGKQFWVCCKPDGPNNNPESRCDSFVWVSSKK